MERELEILCPDIKPSWKQRGYPDIPREKTRKEAGAWTASDRTDSFLLSLFLTCLIDPSTSVAALSQDHCSLTVSIVRPLVRVKNGVSQECPLHGTQQTWRGAQQQQRVKVRAERQAGVRETQQLAKGRPRTRTKTSGML